MPTTPIVYHSPFGHTKVLAERIKIGVESVEGCSAPLIEVSELPPADPETKSLGGRWAELDAADGIVFGCPTYMGSVTGPFKTFMDTSGAVWFRQGWRDKLAGGFTNSGAPAGDKYGAQIAMATFAAQHSMLWVPLGLSGEKDLNRLGGSFGPIAHSENGPPDETPPESDRRTAEEFGRRFGGIAVRWCSYGT
ncbi:MAG: flavodoxin family protein [Planctomycetota bacterium]